MRVLDLDMDYFMKSVATFINESEPERLPEEDYGDRVWSEREVRNFLEGNLGLSKQNRIRRHPSPFAGGVSLSGFIGSQRSKIIADLLQEKSCIFDLFCNFFATDHKEVIIVAVRSQIVHFRNDLRKPGIKKAIFYVQSAK